jgi:hypothetical protein
MSRAGHAAVLAIAVAVVAASMLLTPGAEHVALFGWDLPPLCVFKAVTGWDCPGCGLTRSFVYMGHAAFLEAFRMHGLGPLLYAVVVLQIPLRIRRLATRYRLPATR